MVGTHLPKAIRILHKNVGYVMVRGNAELVMAQVYPQLVMPIYVGHVVEAEDVQLVRAADIQADKYS